MNEPTKPRLRRALFAASVLLAAGVAFVATVLTIALHALTPAADEWRTTVQLGPWTRELSMPGLIRWAAHPLAAPLLDARVLRTRFGRWQLQRNGHDLEAVCAPCRVQIAALGPLSGLPALTSLYLADNKVKDLAPLAKLTRLVSLDLEGNQITDIGPLASVTRLGTLTHFGALTALREWGLEPDKDVALVSLNENANILAGLISGAVDAGVLTDPNSFAAAKAGYPLLADLADFPVEYNSAGFTTTKRAGKSPAVTVSM